MRAFRYAVIAAVCGAALATPASARGQDVQYESVSRVDFAGAAGTAMRMAARLGGGSLETVETTFIKGRKMRTDSDAASTIVDLESGRVTLLDHDARSYTSFTFEEMMDRASESAGNAGADGREMNERGDAAARMNFRFSVDDANERQRVAGYDAQRFFLTMEAEAEAVPEGQTQMEEAGTLVVLTDLWSAKDIPVLQARRVFDDASARQYADAGAALTEGFAAAFSDDPRMQVAFEQSMQEARKIDGMAVKSVTSFVTVAPGQAFNRALVTDPKPAGPSLAQQAGRAAIGGLMGRLGRRAAETPAAAEPEVTQATIFTVTSEVRNVSTPTLDPSLFEVPAGYTEREM